MSKTQPKLIIVDGNALIHRSFHALPPSLRTKKGVLVNAVYGFTAFLLKAINEFRPEYVVLTLDMAGPTFRHDAYIDYKATRVKAPDELYEQIPIVKRVAQAFNIPIFELSGYEADDLIGTICKKTAGLKSLQKIIITGDLDTLQLIDDQTKIYTMSRGLSESVLYGAEEVQTRYGLRPDQIIDYKALRGDPSDNIPGVRGIGEKTACELIGEFGDLDGVYRAATKRSAKIKPRIAELLLASRDNAYLSQSLATIDKKVPLEFSLDNVQFSSFKLEPVLEIFQELEFRSLLAKVKELRDRMNNGWQASKISAAKTAAGGKIVPTGKPAAQSNAEEKFARNAKKFSYQLVDDDKKFRAFLKKLKTRKSFSLEAEYSGTNPLRSPLIGLGFSWKEGEAYFIPTTPGRLASLGPILADPKVKKSGHNLKLIWRLLQKAGWELAGLEFDTMIAAYLLDPANRQYDLSSLAFTELGFEKISKADLISAPPAQLSLGLDGIDPKKLNLSAGEDADFSYRLAAALRPRLRAAELDVVFRNIELPLIPVLGKMENHGIKIDAATLSRLEKRVGNKLIVLEKEICELAGEKFNINSTKQLKEILFVRLEMPTTGIKKTKTGFSTAEDELIKLYNYHPIIALIQDYRELSKLQSTYLQALPKMINPDTGRIHTNFNQTVAATGRLSSNDPNLQNIPVKTEEGQKVRTAFITDKGWRLVGFDYSQIELRLAAHMSGDKKMIAAFCAGQDIHAATAAAIGGVPLDKVTPRMRSEAKAVNFGILYGQGPHGLSQGAGISYAAAQEFIKKYFAAYPGVKRLMDDSVKDARAKGYAVTLFGRRRLLPELDSTIPMVRKAAERMAINTPLQGTAADIIKLAMIKIAARIDGQEDEIRMLLQVHDELIFEIKEDKIEKYAGVIQEIMENPLKLRVPVIVDQKEGNNWGELK